MYLLILAIIVLMLKIYEIPPVNDWSWLIVLLPTAMTFIWKVWADWSGYTLRRNRARIARKKSNNYIE